MVQVADPPIRAAAGMAAGWGDHIGPAALVVDPLQHSRAAGQAGRGEVIVPAGLGPAGPGHRPAGQQLQAVAVGEGLEGGYGLKPVQIQHVEPVAAGQADVGLRVAGPPGQHSRAVGRRLP
jgi:hypothetical protein